MNTRAASTHTMVSARLRAGHSLRLQRQWVCGGLVERVLSLKPDVMNHEMEVGRE